MKILYIEDDQSARSIFENGIPKYVEECQVEIAETGEQGLSRLQSENFDLLVTDLYLPNMSGLDVLRESKANWPNLEVIVLTGHGSIGSAVEAMRLGARDYMEKPIDLALMKEKIENIRSYLRRGQEIEDIHLAKDLVEQQAYQEKHLLEDQVVKSRKAIDEVMSLLSTSSFSADVVTRIKRTLLPFSSHSQEKP